MMAEEHQSERLSLLFASCKNTEALSHHGAGEELKG